MACRRKLGRLLGLLGDFIKFSASFFFCVKINVKINVNAFCIIINVFHNKNEIALCILHIHVIIIVVAYTVDLFSVTKNYQSFSKGTKPSLREVGWLNFHIHLAYLTLL